MIRMESAANVGLTLFDGVLSSERKERRFGSDKVKCNKPRKLC
jgi:hypothetical protein